MEETHGEGISKQETVKEKIESYFQKTTDLLLKKYSESSENPDFEEDILQFAEWTSQKAELRYGEDKTPSLFYSGIFWAYLGTNIGSEENKHRPVIIIRSIKESPVCTVIPLTTKRLNDGKWYHVDLQSHDNTALVEQLRVISKNRIDKPIRKAGSIINAELDMEKIEEIVKSLYANPPRHILEKREQAKTQNM